MLKNVSLKENAASGLFKNGFLRFRSVRVFIFRNVNFIVRQVKSNRCLRLRFMPVNQNPLCRFVCVCRTDMRRRAFESPDLALCFEYLHHGCWKLRKFFTAPQRSGTHFFLGSVHSLFQNLEISGSQKSEFWWSKWLENGQRMTSTVVPGLETSWKHPKHYVPNTLETFRKKTFFKSFWPPKFTLLTPRNF